MIRLGLGEEVEGGLRKSREISYVRISYQVISSHRLDFVGKSSAERSRCLSVFIIVSDVCVMCGDSEGYRRFAR